MVRSTARVPFLFVTLLALGQGSARAEPVAFSYSWSLGGGMLYAGGAGPIHLSSSLSPDGTTLTTDFGSGTATARVAPGGTALAVPGGEDYWHPNTTAIPAALLSTTGLAAGSTGTFYFETSLELSLRLTDTASGESADLPVSSGWFGGVATPNGLLEGGAVLYAYGVAFLGGHMYELNPDY